MCSGIIKEILELKSYLLRPVKNIAAKGVFDPIFYKLLIIFELKQSFLVYDSIQKELFISIPPVFSCFL